MIRLANAALLLLASGLLGCSEEDPDPLRANEDGFAGVCPIDLVPNETYVHRVELAMTAEVVDALMVEGLATRSELKVYVFSSATTCESDETPAGSQVVVRVEAEHGSAGAGTWPPPDDGMLQLQVDVLAGCRAGLVCTEDVTIELTASMGMSHVGLGLNAATRDTLPDDHHVPSDGFTIRVIDD